jgi:endonuclease/exonuclease/phosphatase family metal-dependent hydrolase
VLERRNFVLNPPAFRRALARQLGLGFLARVGWGKERRVCQAVRVQLGTGTLVVGNLHATKYTPDKRLPDAELLRAAVFVDGMARPDEPVLLCGDFNVSVASSRMLADLVKPEWGFIGATPIGVDHVLLRGLRGAPPRRWPPDRRRHDGRLLSDHAPVDVEVT